MDGAQQDGVVGRTVTSGWTEFGVDGKGLYPSVCTEAFQEDD